MTEFGRKYLAVYTPCRISPKKEMIHSIAIVHVELLLVHPFREGNGRLARMLASLMALQAELPPLEFDILKSKKKQEYFFAVQAGLNQNYELMEKIFGEVIAWTLRQRRQPYR
jgi:cell filamentation protein